MVGLAIYVPEELATTPIDGDCIANAWWAVHPDHGVVFYADRKRSC